MCLSRLLSPGWLPVWSSLGLSGVLLGVHYWLGGGSLLLMLFFVWGVVLSLVVWRVSYEAERFCGFDSIYMVDSLLLGMLVVIISEVLFFIAFFWSWFHHKWHPVGGAGQRWVPLGVTRVGWFSIPILNTGLLLFSAFPVTVAHYCLIFKDGEGCVVYLGVGVVLALLFLGLQGVEYFNSSFSLRDGGYGSLFFLITGFHGAHVVLGVLFLLLNISQGLAGTLCSRQHLFFEFRVYYYHFVDVV